MSLIVITGATKGIGRAIAERFAAGGFDLAVCARKASELNQMQEQLHARYGVRVYTQVADMSQKEEVLAFGRFVLELGEPTDVLVNNAGVFIPGAIHQEPEGVLEQLIDTNLYSAYHLTRQLVGGMVTRRQGHIFNICSIASTTAYANGGSYAISKHALYGFSKCLREEMKPHDVRVTAVLPGAVRTASWDGVALPEERFMPVEDIAELIWTCHHLSSRSVVEDLLIRPQLGDI